MLEIPNGCYERQLNLVNTGHEKMFLIMLLVIANLKNINYGEDVL